MDETLARTGQTTYQLVRDFDHKQQRPLFFWFLEHQLQKNDPLVSHCHWVSGDFSISANPSEKLPDFLAQKDPVWVSTI